MFNVLAVKITQLHKQTHKPWTVMRWVTPQISAEDTRNFIVASGVSFGTDKFGQTVMFFPNEWTMRYFTEKNPSVSLHELPPKT